MNNCENNCCGTSNCDSDYSDLILQLKETRDKIDGLIRSLEQREFKDETINKILNTDYDDISDDDDIDREEIKQIIEDVLREKPSTRRNKIKRLTYPFPTDWTWYYYNEY